MITIEQAIQNIIVIKSMYTWSTGADEALDMAITALRNQKSAKEMLEAEEERGERFLHKEYDRGRITAFYDALGISPFN